MGSTPRLIALDVGGTGVRAAVLKDGHLAERSQASLTKRSVEAVLSTCQELIETLGGADFVGVALPGFASHGSIQSSPNFPGWEDVPFRDLLSERVGAVVHVENDASCAAWGAYLSRGSREDLVLLTLGTGVGGGIVLGGRLVTGKVGCGAELGHLYVADGADCGCGAHGCLEAWASTEGIIRIAAARGHRCSDGRAFFEACRSSEEWALTLAEEVGKALGRGLASITNAVNPEVLILSGGLCHGREFLEGAVNAALDFHAIPPARAAVELEWAGRAEDLSLIGAADLARVSTAQDEKKNAAI